MVVLPDPASDKWPFFGHVYLRQDSLPPTHSPRRHRSRDETLRLWNLYLPLEPQKDQFKFVLFLQRLMTMVEEHYRKRHRSGDWKVSKPIEDWYHQSIRDLSGLGIDENLMSSEWREVVQKGNREAAKKERKERRSKHCSREHEMVKCNGRCGLTACVEDAHRCHKIYIDYECTDPDCEKCKKIKEKQEAWEKKVANPTHEEKWVDCPCENPWCRRKVMEIKEIPKPPKPKFYATKP
ncbi:uncharacterized protein Bfra_006289 [Botrytis fragariae]|uniref:Uncharacterized protein n=1 Tax=Botrytis fragariae TaxID=1964551 RepID=A0A8H6B4J4_9HELO|nr:uncharacterized protein Bfra_006289 [Botrytis fragariae]KAF5879085.1 hypothetical protein Bfra_006289 [Botrytis fragariae]